MVYCGKPSKGCAPCRAKRTKCDLKLPVCSQCVRTNRICIGYRHLEAREFRGQSGGDSQKVRNSSRIKQSPFPRTPQIPCPTAHLRTTHTVLPQEQNLSLSHNSLNIRQVNLPFPEDGAVKFFFNDYLLQDSPTPKNIFDCLPRLYGAAPSESALSNIVVGLGIACLANVMQVPGIMMRANLKYARSLQAINSALRDPIEARADETLLVVMLLGLYEEHNITTKSIEPWTNHVKGALALLEYRGKSQMENPIGLQLIRSLRTQVMVNCLIRRVDVPETILKWSRLARDYEVGLEVSESELAELVAKFCNLQAAIESQELDSDSSSFVSSALTIDAELAEWFARWQVPSQHATILVQEPDQDIFEDYWYLYPNIMAASIHSHYRCIRVLVNQIIITQLGCMMINLDPDLVLQYSPVYMDQIDTSRRTIVELSHEICASVPYYLDKYPGDAADNGNSSKNVTGKNARAKVVLWPLYVAGQTESVSDIMRLWLVDQLEGISEQRGTHSLKAKGLAAFLRNRQRAIGPAWRKLGMDCE